VGAMGKKASVPKQVRREPSRTSDLALHGPAKVRLGSPDLLLAGTYNRLHLIQPPLAGWRIGNKPHCIPDPHVQRQRHPADGRTHPAARRYFNRPLARAEISFRGDAMMCIFRPPALHPQYLHTVILPALLASRTVSDLIAPATDDRSRVENIEPCRFSRKKPSFFRISPWPGMLCGMHLPHDSLAPLWAAAECKSDASASGSADELLVDHAQVIGIRIIGIEKVPAQGLPENRMSLIVDDSPQFPR